MSESAAEFEQFRDAWSLAVLRHPDLGPSEKNVLLTLIMYRNRDSGLAWPSAATVAEAATVKRRTALRALQKAEQFGFIVTVVRGGTSTGKNQASQRAFYLPGGSDTAVTTGSDAAVTTVVTQRSRGSDEGGQGVVTQRSRGSDEGGQGVVTPVATQPLIEPLIEPLNEPLNDQGGVGGETLAAGDAAEPAEPAADAAPAETEEAPKPRKKPRCPLPDGWEPRPDVRQQLWDECPDVDQDHELLQFRDYFQANAGTSTDWNLNYRSWIRRQNKWNSQRRSAPNTQRREPTFHEVLAEMYPTAEQDAPVQATAEVITAKEIAS